jgi:hypothetical protein
MADTLRIKRRPATGLAGAPASLAAAEIAYNEKDDILYYGKGDSGGVATSVIPIAGPGFTGGGGGGAAVTLSDTPPAGASAGDLWIETDTQFMYVFIDDGTSQQWVITNPIQLEKGAQGDPGATGPQGPQGPATASKVLISDTPPTAVVGDMWFESDAGRLNIRFDDGDSTQWIQAAASVAEVNTSGLVQKSGDNMSGLLLLSSDPVAPLGAVTKQYSDALRSYTENFTLAIDPRNNIIINGGMEISQQFTTTATSSTNAAWTYTLDQWNNFVQGNGTFAFQQIASVPSTVRGFRNSLRLYCGTAYTMATATDLISVLQPVEGVRWARLGFGGAGALPVTISFWVWATVAGTMSVGIKNAAGDRNYFTPVVINNAATWEYKSVTIPGDIAGNWPNTTAQGASVAFTFASGTTYQAAAPNTWVATSVYAHTGVGNFYAGTNNEVYLTGVTVLPGSVGPTAAQSPLMMRHYAEDLAQCQRYWQMLTSLVFWGYNGAGALVYTSISWPVQMRAAPTTTLIGAAYGNGSGLAVWNASPTLVGFQFAISAAGSGTATLTQINASARM